MLSWQEYKKLCGIATNRPIDRNVNQGQHDAISAPANTSSVVVAGPGSGKTTVLTLRVLKLILVDGHDPGSALVTTFTKKAAAELRSRILGWGDQIRRAALSDKALSHVHPQIKALDFNRILTGTIDSISEKLLTDNRPPGQPAPIVIEDFVSNALMARAGLFSGGRYRDQNLKDYINDLRGIAYGLSLPVLSGSLRTIKDRLYSDQVDRQAYLNSALGSPGIQKAFEAIAAYESELVNRLVFDFVHIEHQLLSQLSTGNLNDFLAGIRFILVDEYQDSNLLQDSIYLKIAQAAIANGGGISVVGDDDQSLYRFRGATVDLFQTFGARLKSALGVQPATFYLSKNYRSTSNIVDFCKGFAVLDKEYQTARVSGKPALQTARQGQYENFPLLGMFRDDVNELAQALADFVHNVTHGKGVKVKDKAGKIYTIAVNQNGGSAGDIVLLASSPNDYDSGGKARLPLLLRQQLLTRTPRMQVFNPRGQELRQVPDVTNLCGLLLDCIDPAAGIQNTLNTLPRDVIDTLNAWRASAQQYVGTRPAPSLKPSLGDFVAAWEKRESLTGRPWEERVSLMDLIYKLLTWLPAMQSDVEGLVYLEAITRTVAQAALVASFGADIVVDNGNPGLEQASIKDALWNIFVPLASGAIDVNEDLLETLPKDRINVMSVHQSKGLEFPLTIIDVGSDFRMEHKGHRFKRFPTEGGETTNLEDKLRPFSPLGAQSRPALDRAFDDLIRQYFVAFSRAQDVLLLVGLTTVRDGYVLKSGKDRQIPHIATGWDRVGTWHWRVGLPNLIQI